MRTTVTLDDVLIAKAQALTGLSEKSAPLKEALKALIERDKRLLVAANQLGLAAMQMH